MSDKTMEKPRPERLWVVRNRSDNQMWVKTEKPVQYEHYHFFDTFEVAALRSPMEGEAPEVTLKVECDRPHELIDVANHNAVSEWAAKNGMMLVPFSTSTTAGFAPREAPEASGEVEVVGVVLQDGAQVRVAAPPQEDGRETEDGTSLAAVCYPVLRRAYSAGELTAAQFSDAHRLLRVEETTLWQYRVVRDLVISDLRGCAVEFDARGDEMHAAQCRLAAEFIERDPIRQEDPND